jgi:predicted transcriptional regulator
MLDKKQSQPSEAELEILQILWKKQPLTVRAIYEIIGQRKEIGYTTVLKQVQRMYENKKILSRYKEGKVHYYSAIIQEEEVKSNSFNRFLNTVFKGSTSQLIMHALGEQSTSEAELDELEKWLKERRKD